MIRRVPLRPSRMVKRPPRRLDDETEGETAYKDWLHTQPCAVTGYVGELVQASHMGHGGMGQKNGSWYDAVPMRADVHAEWGEHRGRYAGWTKEARRDYGAELVASTWQRYVTTAWTTVREV